MSGSPAGDEVGSFESGGEVGSLGEVGGPSYCQMIEKVRILI